MNWYLKVLNQYFDFSGRARRMEYWMFTLVNALISFGVGIFDSIIGANEILGTVYSLAIFIPGMAVTVRRLHDVGKSGWLMLVPFVAIVLTFALGFIFLDLSDSTSESTLLVFIFGLFGFIALASFIWITVLLFTDSKPDNKYGPNPKNPNYDEISEIGKGLE